MRRLRLPPSLNKTPIKSNCSKRATASNPTAIPARKFTPACTSTTNSASANSLASISTSTAPSNPSKSPPSTSPIRAAAPPTSSPAPSPTILIPPSSTPPPTRMSAPSPSASSAWSPATTSNIASSPPLRTTPSPPTSGSTTPSTAPESSSMKFSNSTSRPRVNLKSGSIPLRQQSPQTNLARAMPPVQLIAGSGQQQIRLHDRKLRPRNPRKPNPTSPFRHRDGRCFPSASTKDLCRVQNHWKTSAPTKNRYRRFLENARSLQKLRRKRLNSQKRRKPIRAGWKPSTTLSLRRSPQLISRSGQRGLQRDQQTRCSQLATRLLKTSSSSSPR